jgi:hypothetical protein
MEQNVDEAENILTAEFDLNIAEREQAREEGRFVPALWCYMNTRHQSVICHTCPIFLQK